jgi:hypothetical protein
MHEVRAGELRGDRTGAAPRSAWQGDDPIRAPAFAPAVMAEVLVVILIFAAAAFITGF